MGVTAVVWPNEDQITDVKVPLNILFYLWRESMYIFPPNNNFLCLLSLTFHGMTCETQAQPNICLTNAHIGQDIWFSSTLQVERECQMYFKFSTPG